ncbi:exo-beta-N-acetylmuramidase NamZ family protein [Coprobacter tertius]|uniref:DUF1343 domain-containing protein n=1 Tax=Coprobacter tertius TaxID=2944915 RepID=A0ABT1MKF5_9BACT|nr:DUF1343 domain-containing protein [Coprobacter tertius]MCP9612854.1 DUF1343 domain-containing protein [Coprobacter tertius]
MRLLYSFVIILAFSFVSVTVSAGVRVGADRMELLLPLLKDKKVGLVVNHTSLLSGRGVHLLDTLIAEGVMIKKIFAPEHGFRGYADAGETVDNSFDERTGLPVISLYGKNKKPTNDQFNGLDVIVFDIQDVGARFYTYISTLLYVMQTCAETGKPIIVLDRPNPNDYVDGPIMEDSLKSFVGALPLPVLYGLTIGELSHMIVGEKWYGKNELSLTVIPVSGWSHGQPYALPVKPSPNLPDMRAVRFYPSLCFFEATRVSVGRGTKYPFQIIGAPNKKYGNFTFTPRSLPGYDKNPLQKGVLCYGIDLRDSIMPEGLTLTYLLRFYRLSGEKEKFFSSPSFFDKLMGNRRVRQDILSGKSENEIKDRWASELQEYKKMRKKYLMYPDYK